MMQTWFKIFFRSSKKSWLNLVINITGLTLGFAGLLIVLLLFDDEKSYNQWNPNKDNIYRVANKSPENGIWHVGTSSQEVLYKSDIPEVIETILISPHYRSRVINFEDKKVFTEKTTFTQSDFFEFFPFEIIAGSTDKFSESESHIAISQSISEQLFGPNNAIGESVKIANEKYTITCVYKISKNSHYESELLIHYKPFELSWGNYNNELFCLFKTEANSAEVKQKMDQIIIDDHHKIQAEDGGITLEEFKDKYGYDEVLLECLSTIRLHNKANNAGPEGKGNYQLLLSLLSLSILLVVISCANFINLSTASAGQRAKEVGVKKTLGLSKFKIIIQAISEIVFQGIIALTLALVLVEFVLPYFNQFMDKELSILNLDILFRVIIIALLTSLFIGILPALYLANFKTTEVLKGNFLRSKKGVTARNMMLLLQFLIAGFFMINVFVIHFQMDYMINKDIGFEKEQVIVVDVFAIDDPYKKYKLTKNVLAKHDNILGVSSSMFIPGDGYVNGTSISYKEGDVDFNCASNTVDYNYPDFAQLNFLKGRSFSSQFTSDTVTSIILNETAAKRLGIYDNPIGKKVRVGWQRDKDKRKLEVVGMVQDYHFSGFDLKIEPMFLIHWETFPFVKDWFHSVQFKIKSENASQTIEDIELFWKQNVDSEYPFSYKFLDKNFAKTYEKYERQQTLLSILSIVVIIISLLGLFALTTLTVQQRLKEVAIRKTLGGSVNSIVFELIKSFIYLVVIASVFLIPISYYFMQNWLDNFVYRISMPIIPYLITPLVLILLVITVAGIKAINATKVDLIKYLKFE